MTIRRAFVGVLTVVLLGPGPTATADLPPRSAVAELLEDDAEGLLKRLTNPTGDSGEGHPEKNVVFSGKASIRIVPMQRYDPNIPGWKYRITENPKPGEYRYLRFAWRADGCAGLMLQMHDEKDWFIRYTAGVDRFNWGTKFVADKPPERWTVVTRDLFRDYGERTITGIALTAFDGKAAYFDHIYFGRTLDDLDRIDATGLRDGKPPEPTADELERLWQDLAEDDAARAYRALWTLAAAPKQAVPFLARKLAVPSPAVDVKQIQRWILELDDDQFLVRQEATKRLAEHIDGAARLLEKELERSSSSEVRARIERLLAARKKGGKDSDRIGKGIRALEYMETAESREWLERLAKEGGGAEVAEAARAALQRSEAFRKK